MIRLGISVEGATEREFVSRVLAPELARNQVFASPIDMRGRVSLQRISREINSLLAMFDYVTTFYDFYGFQKRPQGDVEALEIAISELVSPGQRHRLMPYVQQYEFEALVLAAHDQAEAVMAIRSLSDRFKKIVADSGGAEKVNDGYDTCPSRRIKALAPQYEKKFHGPVILEEGLAAARVGCPRFDAWLTQLSQLAAQG
ncbi:DUF4276 family protein [Halomonas sp. DQ26W]|uniref:DUF4276 family protein n=1 Tax=Halomonas sp. DQ26W TaxID=2282311 RepID=UPI000DF817C9|nr:DUF4276 family protein [Halomonas sp. DQ26W]RDB43431.1 DUF4276 family protein [Halomonas sp. DQ26W]